METLVYVGLGNAAAAVAVAALAAAVARLGRRPALTHRAWLLVYLKLLAPPLLAVPVPWLFAAAVTVPDSGSPSPAPSGSGPAPVAGSPGLPKIPAPATHASRRTPPEPPAAGWPGLPDVSPGGAPEDEPGPRPFPETSAPSFHPVPDPEPVPIPDFTPEPAPGPALSLPPWPAVVGGVWLAGSLLWWAVAAARVVRFDRVLREARPAPPEVVDRLRRLAARLGLGWLPRAYVADAAVPPLVWAPGPAASLLLPAALWERLGDAGRDALLAHELAHLRRRDHWVRRLEWLVQGLYWWHPLVWWVRGRVQQAEEECCDAWVGWALPGAAAAYAATLVEAVAYVSRARAATPAGASGGGRTRGLKRRLAMILNDRPERGLTWGGVAAVVAAAALLLPLVPCWAEPAAPPAAADEAPPPATAARPRGGDEKPEPPRLLPVRPARAAAPASPAGGGDPLRPAGGAPAAADPDPLRAPAAVASGEVPAATVQDARDAVELLEVQLGAKRAQLDAAKVTAGESAKGFERVKRLRDNGGVSAEDFGKAEAEAAVHLAEIRVKEAEVQESAIRLRQARRRLAALSGAATLTGVAETDPTAPRPAPKAPDPAPGGGARGPKNADSLRQLERLERQIEELRREVESLRRELRPQAGGAPSAGGVSSGLRR